MSVRALLSPAPTYYRTTQVSHAIGVKKTIPLIKGLRPFRPRLCIFPIKLGTRRRTLHSTRLDLLTVPRRQCILNDRNIIICLAKRSHPSTQTYIRGRHFAPNIFIPRHLHAPRTFVRHLHLIFLPPHIFAPLGICTPDHFVPRASAPPYPTHHRGGGRWWRAVAAGGGGRRWQAVAGGGWWWRVAACGGKARDEWGVGGGRCVVGGRWRVVSA